MKILITEHHSYNKTKKTFDLLQVNNTITNNFNILGKELVTNTLRSMNSAKSGNLNQRLNKLRSAKGEALANDSGATSKSISYKLNGSKYMDFGGKTKQLAVWEGAGSGKYNNRPTLLNQVKKFAPILKKAK